MAAQKKRKRSTSAKAEQKREIKRMQLITREDTRAALGKIAEIVKSWAGTNIGGLIIGVAVVYVMMKLGWDDFASLMGKLAKDIAAGVIPADGPLATAYDVVYGSGFETGEFYARMMSGDLTTQEHAALTLISPISGMLYQISQTGYGWGIPPGALTPGGPA